MALKRPLREDGEEDLEVPTGAYKRRQVLAALCKQRNAAVVMEECLPYLEPMIRKMVQEAVDHGIDRFLRPSFNQIEGSGSRPWQLQFHSNLPTTLFTNSNVLSEDKSSVKIVLCDSITKTIVKSGPLSSVRVSIVVLDGDFGSDEQEDWPKEDFDRKIVQNREGKRPLVTGELVVSLKDGVGCIGEVNFTDNSCWIRSRKFRLGAKAQNGSDRMRIREGITNAFKVKDHRGESYQKHHPPSLDDEVWRLEKIAKDGASHKRLSQFQIYFVKDFLRTYVVDKFLLRTVLCVSNKTWETIIGHAKTCTLDGKKYLYRNGHSTGLLFDSIYRVVGVTFDGQNLCSLDYLDTHQMRVMEDLKQHAYKNAKDWIPVADPSIVADSMLLTSAGADHLNPRFDPEDCKFLVDQDQFEMQINHDHLTISPLYNHEVEQEYSTIKNLSDESSHKMHVFNPTSINHFGMTDSQGGIYNCAFGGNCMASQLSTDDLPIDDSFMVGPSDCYENELFFGACNREIVSSNSGILVPMNGKPKTSWYKVLVVVKWRILVRRNIAAKKLKYFYNYV